MNLFFLWSSLLLFSFYTKEKSPPKHTPIFPVTVAKVQKKDVPIYLETIGHAAPLVHVNITSSAQGQITGVYFEEGAEIKKGDLLFTIDPKEMQAAVEKAKGAVQESNARLDIAKEKVLRYFPLTEEDYFAKLHFDELKSDLHAMRGALMQAKASLLQAEIDLSYCWIYSPLDGKAGILAMDEGNMVKGDDSQTLVTIQQIQPIYISFFLPGKHLQTIQTYRRKANTLRTIVSRDGFHKDFLEGTLEMMDNEIDTDTGTITLRSIFPNEAESLWPGQHVQVRLILRTEKDALVIPYAAVNYDRDGPFVFVVTKERSVKKRSLRLSNRSQEQVIVEKGLRNEETVVILGGQNLYTGAKVAIKGDHK